MRHFIVTFSGSLVIANRIIYEYNERIVAAYAEKHISLAVMKKGSLQSISTESKMEMNT